MRKFSLFDTNSLSSEQEEIGGERFETLLSGREFRLLRIVSTGQATPPGEWYDQDDDEWVAVISGSAALRFEGSDTPVTLSPGEGILIPAHCRHRVEQTHPDEPTVWLALHANSAN